MKRCWMKHGGINGGLTLTVDKPVSIISSRVWRTANNPFQTKNQRRPPLDRYPIESPEPVDSAKRNLFILYPFYAGPFVNRWVSGVARVCTCVCVCGWMIWSEQFRSTGNGVTNNSGIESKWRIMTSMRDELFLLFGRGSLARIFRNGI